MSARMWDIRPGDKVGLDSGETGWVSAICSFYGVVIGLQVGLNWHNIETVVSWLPGER